MVVTTAGNLHQVRVKDPSLARVLILSVVAHVLVIVALSVSLSNTIRMAPPAAMKVTLVGVPQPQAAMKPVEKVEEVRTQDSAAPKEPPPEMKNIPPSEAKTKFMEKPVEPPKEDKPNPVEAKERPPLLDKNPEKKKVVKNNKDAKVVKNPEDFLKSLDFLENIEAAPSKVKPVQTAKATDKPAGDGPEIQLNMADEGVVDGIRQKVQQNWSTPMGMDTRGLVVVVWAEVDEQGNVLSAGVRNGSGNDVFDRSLVNAVRKATPLPIPAGETNFKKFQKLELAFQG